MTCEDVQEQLSAFSDGELPDGEVASVLRHAGECRTCREFLERLMSVRSSVSRLPMVEPGPALDGKIAGIRLPEIPRLAPRGERAGLRQIWTRSLRVPAAALAAGLALFLMTTALTLWFWLAGPKPDEHEVVYVFGLPQVEVISTTGAEQPTERNTHE
jgi:anti-sigma factor RsiW